MSIWASESKTPLLLVSLLRGAIVFLSDLMHAIDVPVQLDSISISSYGVSTGPLPRQSPALLWPSYPMGPALQG